MNDQNGRARVLQESGRFQELPSAIREWILASPSATEDFSEFFERGGRVMPRPDAGKPQYTASVPPVIGVDRNQWEALSGPDTRWAQRSFFATLAHEIGHDRFNTSIPFKGSTASEYVHYRAGLEAEAIFNAFPIFKDLKDHHDFKQSFPFNEVGYLNGLELGQLYKDWNAGTLNDKQVVERIAAKIPDRDYTLGGAVQDVSGDGKITHRDLYLQDYEQLVKPKQNKQTGLDEPINALERSLGDGVSGLDKQAGKGWDDNSDRLYAGLLRTAKENGFGPDDTVQIAFNMQSERYQRGELIHLARTSPFASPDPAANRACALTAELLKTPSAESMGKAQEIPHAPQAPQTAMQQGSMPDDPIRQSPGLRV